ncbi:g7085 [Coccomyxa viridis]|uniref:G7085 protein n=1 Tax=Coccomyxa viridis TaxID=1274662 RepID=A0ABP1FWZ0_9CHLO
MHEKPQLGLAICFLAVSLGGRHVTALRGSERHLEQLSFSIPSSAIPGLLGLASPTTPSPAPVPGTSAPSAEAAAAASPHTDDNADAQPPEAPSTGIMGLLPMMGNNLLQRMHNNQNDTSNVHTLNLTISAATAPAPGPSKLQTSQQLGNITTEQQGPDIKVDVHVDPVIAVNGGVHISANGTDAMPLLAAVLPPSPVSGPPPPTVYGGTTLPDSHADDGPVTALPPVTPEENAAFNTAVPPAICGGGAASSMACPPATQPYTQSLLARNTPERSIDDPSSSTGIRSLSQGPTGLPLDALLGSNDTQQDSAKILAAVEGAAQAVHNLSPPGANAASPSGVPAGSTSSSSESPASSDEAHPGAAASPYAREGAVFPQGGVIWPPRFDSPSNWALILTATSSTITCVAVIFLVLLFLVFRVSGGRASGTREGGSRNVPGQALPPKGSGSSLVSQDSHRKRLQRLSPGRERRVRMLRFLDRRTSTITPARATSPLPQDLEKGVPRRASPPQGVSSPLRGSSSPTSQDALLPPQNRQRASAFKPRVPKATAAGAIISSGPMPLPSPFASRQEQNVGGSPGAESPGIAPSPFASKEVQAPFSSPPHSADSGRPAQHSSSGFLSCL